MGSVRANVNSDYPLSGVVTYFEAYMFVTTQKHIAEHTLPLQGELILVDGNRGVTVTPMADPNDRSASLTAFNRMAKAKIPSMPKPSGLSCCLIDFIGDDDCSDADYDSAYAELKDKFIKFMTDNDRVAAMTQHWPQGRRYPHVHILYQRKRGKHDEFQNWLCGE